MVLGTGTARAVSEDGSTVVGSRSGDAFRWTVPEGFTTIGPGRAAGVSGDGSIIVGNGGTGDAGIYRWTSETGPVDLGGTPFPEGERPQFAVGVSNDGQVIGGQWQNSVRPDWQPFLWTSPQGFTLPAPEMADDDNTIWAMSPDGTSFSGDFDETFAFVLTPENGLITLRHPATLPGFNNALFDVTWGGTKAVGSSSLDDDLLHQLGLEGIDPGDNATIWDAEGGLRLLEEELLGFGLAKQLEGWHLESAMGIADDGSVIVGSGLTPKGDRKFWVATMVSEPGAFALLGATALALLARPRQTMLRKGH